MKDDDKRRIRKRILILNIVGQLISTSGFIIFLSVKRTVAARVFAISCCLISIALNLIGRAMKQE